MAVISELIDVGLRLQSQGKREAAIEHFRQLQETYPGNARVKFELAAAWSAFGAPERALPLYRELLALPKGKGLPARDVPRLYVRLGASLYSLHEYEEALEIIEEGLRLHPSYRPLRAFRILNRYAAGSAGMALLDALDLMLDSLAPSRWDIFEDDVKRLVSQLRQSLSEASQRGAESAPPATEPAAAQAAPTPDADGNFELEVKVLPSALKGGKGGGKPRKGGQLSKSKVRIHISGAGESKSAGEAGADEDLDADGSAKVNIPIDFG